MSRKRVVVLGGLLVALVAPVVVVASSPELRHRAHLRWEARRLHSADPATRKAAVAALVERGGEDLEELFPEAVAAAIFGVASRSVFVGGRAGPGDDDVIPVEIPSGCVVHSVDCTVERAYETVPEHVSVDPSKGEVRPFYRPTGGRALWVVSAGEVEMIVPLEGERGERILAAVEDRLREER